MLNILLIEDEDAVAVMLTMALERCGFAVQIAKDGREGIRKFDEDQFDLVITDIRMNRPDGHDVLNHIRNSPREFTPTVGITATPWDPEKSEFDAVLSKPFLIQTLVDTVERLTKGTLFCDIKPHMKLSLCDKSSIAFY